MKEKIYAIPITDALKETDFCPFCYIKETLEKESLEYTIGPSYMEGDIRAVSDELGFCNRHFDIIMSEQNKLGVALMSHTHMQKMIKEIEILKDVTSEEKKSFFKKSKSPNENSLAQFIDKTSKSCFMCKRIDDNFERYMKSFLYLFNNDANIRQLFIDSKGVCLSHFSSLLNEAEKHMKPKELEEFKTILVEKQLDNLKVLEENLDFFVKKFDYKNNHLPWGDKGRRGNECK